MTCQKCPSLCASRTQIVEPDLPEFECASGTSVADRRPCRVLVIGEAPGADEDAQGKGFVGRAGRTLHRLLEEHGLRRGFDYGCANIVRCRPPENRKPTKDEVGNCLSRLSETLVRAKPDALLLVGGTAVSVFCGPGALWGCIQEANREEYRTRNPLLAHQAVREYLSQYRPLLVPMPHTSPLAWNRNAPDGRKWAEVGAEQVRRMGLAL
ncbi:uracil-DNA glycosylase [Acidithiobacillus thiooxidans]|nr:uracil-DNA glycosylase [Acidithiobacillus thiooxidans]